MIGKTQAIGAVRHMVMVFFVAVTCPLDIRAWAADLPLPGTTVGMAAYRKSISPIEKRVFFVTNRKSTATRVLSQQFGDEVSDAPSFGVARVNLAAASEDDRFVKSEVRSISRLSKTELPASLNSHPYKSSNTIVFVHGFNTSFDAAVRGAAEFRRNVHAEGPIVVVSWTSQNRWIRYLRDEEEVDLAVTMLSGLLTDLAGSQSRKVQIVAFSMGSRAVVKALRRIFDSSERGALSQVSQIVLAAPDINRDTMDADMLPVLEASKIPTTLYVADPDFWSWLSGVIHSKERVGGLSPSSIYTRPSITTIDVSNVDKSVTGHPAVFESPAVWSDLYYLLNRGLQASQRRQLQRIEINSGEYWRFRQL